MAVASEACIERDRGQIVAAIEHGIERPRQPLVQHVIVDRRADHLVEHVAEMERRQVCDRQLVWRHSTCWRARDATASLTRSSARLRLACAERRTGHLPGRTDRSDRFNRSSPSNFGLERIRLALLEPRSTAGCAASWPLPATSPARPRPSPRIETCSGASASPNRSAIARSPMHPGKLMLVRRIGRKIDRVARRARDMAPRRFVLGKQAAERQHDRIETLPLDLAADVRGRAAPRTRRSAVRRFRTGICV